MRKKKSSKKGSNNNNNNKKKSKKVVVGGPKNVHNNNNNTSVDTATAGQWNFVPEAGPGCYICRRDWSPDWLIEWEDVDPNDFIDENDNDDDDEHDDNNDIDEGCLDSSSSNVVPDVAIDTDEQTLSVCNISKTITKVAYVTVYDAWCFGKDGKTLLKHGSTTDNSGQTNHRCITFIVLCPPTTFCHLVYLKPISSSVTGTTIDLTDLRIESDVSPWRVHPCPNDEHPFRIGFPLGRIPKSPMVGDHDDDDDHDDDNKNSKNNDKYTDDCSFFCTQGEGGRLTHFFSGNQHAIDFRCPVGTEILAVSDGIVIESNDTNTLTGIAVTNLFEWNSIMLQVDTTSSYVVQDQETMIPSDDNSADDQQQQQQQQKDDGQLFVEYVHISKSIVHKGDTVKRGQVIGYSGSVGFSPEPHLHFSAFRSTDPQAPTVRVKFQSTEEPHNSPPFLPVAGGMYNTTGLVKD